MIDIFQITELIKTRFDWSTTERINMRPKEICNVIGVANSNRNSIIVGKALTLLGADKVVSGPFRRYAIPKKWIGQMNPYTQQTIDDEASGLQKWQAFKSVYGRTISARLFAHVAADAAVAGRIVEAMAEIALAQYNGDIEKAQRLNFQLHADLATKEAVQ